MTGVTLEIARSLALALPEATEQDHHGMSSFRIRGKIFATVPDPGHLRIMVGEDEIRACVAEDPHAFSELYWGKRLACVTVQLSEVGSKRLSELLTEAWLRKAPASVAREFRRRAGYAS
ncbi:MmcQ/YjbR family DNA-binding protein [Skermania sp. ID1734]|uniref:MmcQ/YjbR family DNA-binding protein n=1 Tax=Skermania sp. ID1734 TaxID=2597516 RepID=UPI00163DC11A|nr:MmcQ/YjbR family DNA-binding protein [Skermania sp. ID1734]